jgi:Ca-activated chloride channel family protein
MLLRTLHFEWPWVFFALALVPLLWIRSRRAPAPAARFNGSAPGIRSRRQRYLWLPAGLRCLALIALIIAAARPETGATLSRDITKSIAIEVLIDRSTSMLHGDMIYAGRRSTRLNAVRALSRQFIFGNDRDLKGRPNDMIGLIEFASDPITLCPLTLDHQRLNGLIGHVEAAQGDEDGTAIGDAVALASARLKEAESAAHAPLKSKVIVLLTDGENNMGTRTPFDAAALAKQWGVKIYAIGISPVGGNSGAYDALMQTGLEALADETGGLARMVSDSAALAEVYREIDRLEPTEILPPKRSGGRPVLESFAIAALCLLTLETALAQTWLRRVP